VKVIVTGATGHMGAYLCQHLTNAGWEVVAASRSGQMPRVAFEALPDSSSVRPLVLDLSLENVPEVLGKELGPEVSLVHLAAWHPPATAASTPADRSRLIEVNVQGTLRVLDAVRAGGGARGVVYASTFEVYGVPSGSEPVTEAAPTRPFSDYGATKLAGEDHLFAFTAEEGIPTLSLRMPAIYGPGEHVSRALPNFLRSVARGERPKIYGDGQDLRDQLHAADAALGVECALASRRSGAYNLADGTPHSVLSLARAALAVAGLGGEPELLPAQKKRFDFHMSIAKARSELGFEPRVPLAEGMAEQLRWLRSLPDHCKLPDHGK
jgi:nucleoside-diphosphate-sugar epimerase